MMPDSSKVVPDYPLTEGDSDSVTGNAILIPCNPSFDIPLPHVKPPTNLDRCDIFRTTDHIQSMKPLFLSFAFWLAHLPLQTTERAIHLVHPGSRQWSFVQQNGDMDDLHFKYFAWELAPDIPSTSGRKTTTIVMAMPPWTLTPTDLHGFVACKEARTQAF